MGDAQCLGNDLILVLDMVNGQVEAGDARARASEMRSVETPRSPGWVQALPIHRGRDAWALRAVLRGIEAEQDMAPGVAVASEDSASGS